MCKVEGLYMHAYPLTRCTIIRTKQREERFPHPHSGNLYIERLAASAFKRISAASPTDNLFMNLPLSA